MMNDDRQILLQALAFHDHCCWVSVAGLHVRLAALRVLKVNRSGGHPLHAFVEVA